MLKYNTLQSPLGLRNPCRRLACCSWVVNDWNQTDFHKRTVLFALAKSVKSHSGSRATKAPDSVIFKRVTLASEKATPPEISPHLLGGDSFSILFTYPSFQKTGSVFPEETRGFSRKIRIPGFRMDMEGTPRNLRFAHEHRPRPRRRRPSRCRSHWCCS